MYRNLRLSAQGSLHIEVVKIKLNIWNTPFNFYVGNISGLNLGLVVAQFIIKNINSHGDYSDDSEELMPNTKREGGSLL